MGMAAETVPRTWTIASWLVAGVATEPATVADALLAAGPDAVALQSLREDDAERIAERWGSSCAWELSFYPRSRLLPGSGLGLAVLSRHEIGDSVSFVTNNHSSTWSKHRRIAQFAVVRRSDHTGYTIGHAIGSPDPEPTGLPPAPLVWFRPEQIDADAHRAVDLPEGASAGEFVRTSPHGANSPMLLVSFQMPWVRGDFATG